MTTSLIYWDARPEALTQPKFTSELLSQDHVSAMHQFCARNFNPAIPTSIVTELSIYWTRCRHQTKTNRTGRAHFRHFSLGILRRIHQALNRNIDNVSGQTLGHLHNRAKTSEPAVRSQRQQQAVQLGHTVRQRRQTPLHIREIGKVAQVLVARTA
jgi:hypothetical protein